MRRVTRISGWSHDDATGACVSEPTAKPGTTGTPGGGAGAASGGGDALAASLRPSVDWRAVWPIPVMLLATGLLVGGVAMAVVRAPKADPLAPMRLAQEHFEATEYEAVIETLNSKVAPAIEAGMLGEQQLMEFHLLRARSIAQGQQRLGINREENHRAVVADYARAEELGAKLTNADRVAIAESKLGIGNVDEAVSIAKSLPETERDRRMRLYMRVVETNLKSGDLRGDMTLNLLNELMDNPGASVDDRAWALARQTELRLSGDYYDEAIAVLLRSLPRLDASASLRDDRKAELQFLLGKAYAGVQQYPQAQRQLDSALRLMQGVSPMAGETRLLQAQILRATGQLEEAREKYAQVRDEYQGTPVLMPALFGLAQANAALGDDDGALENFQKVLDEMSKEAGATRASERDARRDLTPEMVRAELMTLHTDRFEREPARALQYAQLAERAWTLAQERSGTAGAEPADRPADVLLAMAQAHLRMADEAEAVVGDGSSDGGQTSVSASQLKRHLLDAGAYFREHARAVVVNDNPAYMQSLWNAAEAFDKAGDRPSAKEAFQSYIDGAADDDARKSEARFRLAQNFQADRDYVTAASLYRQLRAAVIRDDAAGPSGRQGPPGATLWADRAVVPLSRCLLLDSDESNDEQAEGLLREMVDGTLLSPESIEFRDALVELGELYHRQGRYPEAISRLAEVLERYPAVPRRTTLMYKLADANRLEAAAIRQTLLSAMPQGERQALVQMRAQRLSDGASLLERVLEDLEARDRSGMSELEIVQQRNAMFFKGDIAMEREDYAGAIAAYDTAAQRYANQPASLVALTQIVAAYAAQKQWSEAATANERAKRQLAAMPEDAFNDPLLPMERRHWEKWFEASMAIEDQRRLDDTSATAGAGNAAEQ